MREVVGCGEIGHQLSIDTARDEAYFEVITFVPHGTPSRRPA
jgi:hypothetical protein